MHTYAFQHTHTEHTHTPKENSENLHVLYLYAFPIRAPYSDKFYKSITFYWDVSIAVCLWGGHSTLLRTGGLNSFLPLGCGLLLGSGESNSDGSSPRPRVTHNSTSDFPLELRSLLAPYQSVVSETRFKVPQGNSQLWKRCSWIFLFVCLIFFSCWDSTFWNQLLT